jgi:phosphomannomutase
MTLIKSISGIRGTIGGPAGDTLNPLDIVKFTSAYATFIRRSGQSSSNTIVVGRDARISGEMVKNVVVGTLMGMGWDVVDIDLASTPTTRSAKPRFFKSTAIEPPINPTPIIPTCLSTFLFIRHLQLLQHHEPCLK